MWPDRVIGAFSRLSHWAIATGVMAASEIPPQMANFQTFSLAAFYFYWQLKLHTLHTATLC